MVGTGSGTVSCTFEEIADGTPIGRINYYDYQIEEGKAFEARLTTGAIKDNDSVVLTDDSGIIEGGDYISAADPDSSALITIENADEQAGTTYGEGRYPKGDAAILFAQPNEGYAFGGWFDANGNLISSSNYCEYVVSKSITIKAVFFALENEQGDDEPTIEDSGTCGDTATWSLKDTGTLIISGTGEMKDYALDKHITISAGSSSTTYLTSAPWKDQAGSIKKVVIEEGITHIGKASFGSCSNIESVSIPSSVESIGAFAFFSCSSLAEIELNPNLREIGASAFYGCTALNSITIPKSVQSIREYAFSTCSNLSKIYFCWNMPTVETDFLYKVTADAYYPSGNPFWGDEQKQQYGGNITWKEWNSPDIQVYSIESAKVTTQKEVYAYTGNAIKPIVTVYYDDQELTSGKDYSISYSDNVNVGNGQIIIQGIGNYSGTVTKDFRIAHMLGDNIEWSLDDNGKLVFVGSGDIRDFNPNYIDDDNPEWTNMVKSIVFDERITGIGAWAFWCNYELSEVNIPDAVTKIGDYAFYQDSGIKDITFGTGLTHIGKRSFRNCTNISSMNMPESLAYLGESFISGCTSLKEIHFTGDAPEFDANAFGGADVTVYYPDSNSTWTPDKLQQYGGKVKWIGSESGESPTTVSIADCLINLGQSVFWHDGSAKTPAVSVYYDANLLRENTDYSVEYSNNTNAGNGTVTINGMGSYVGTVTKSFRIIENGAATASGTCGEHLLWNLDDKGILVISGSGPMDNWTRTEPSPWNGQSDSIKMVIINDGVTTIGEYAFYGCEKIECAMIGNAVEEIGESAFVMTYSLSEICIPDSVKTIHKSAFSAGGLDKVVLGKGVSRIEDGAFSDNFGIKEIVFPEGLTYLGNRALDGNPVEKVYFCGEAPEIAASIYLNGWEAIGFYPVWSDTWNENTRSRVFLGNATWKSWNPSDKREINYCSIQLKQKDFTYTGKAIVPEFEVWDGDRVLVEGTDFSVSFKNNTNAGMASIVAKGIGSYYGTIENEFNIKRVDISDAEVSRLSDQPYTGKPIVLKPMVSLNGSALRENTDYSISISNNTEIGTATLTVNGKGNYAGKIEKSFNIIPKTITPTITLSQETFAYNGEAHEPSVTVKDGEVLLTEGTDYTVTIENNVYPGKANVNVTCTGHYIGSGVKTFTISELGTPNLSSVTAVKGGISIKWKAVDGSDQYCVLRKTGSDDWSKLAVVTGTSYTDETVAAGQKYSYTICCVADDESTYVSGYDNTGKVLTFAVTPVLGSVSNTASGVKITWKKAAGSAKYRIFRKTGSGKWAKLIDTTALNYLDKSVKSGTKYTYTVRCVTSNGKQYASWYNTVGKSTVFVKRPIISKITSPKAKQLSAKWGKITGITGYQIQYSLSKTFSSGNKTVTVKGASSVSKTIGNLKSKKRYYVRLRTYKIVSGKKYYSVWSTVKNVVIK